jgi:general L-amino acid transport system permease protein
MTTLASRLPEVAHPAARLGQVRHWIRKNLFANAFDSLLTIALLYFVLQGAWTTVKWGVLNGVGFNGTPQACDAGTGACWAAVGNNLFLFLFGTYPAEARWRAGAALLIVLLSFSTFIFRPIRRARVAIPIYVVSVGTILTLLSGGGFSRLEQIDLDLIGGFLLTWFIAWIALPMALPLAVMLALARQSTLPAISMLAAGFIDLVRGLPMIVVLFFAAVMLPLFVEGGANMPKVVRAIIGIIIFAAAYQAEVIRGGLQAIPTGQYEAAYGLGLSYWYVQTRIVLPQVFPIVVRPMAGQYIGFFKNTSLVSVIGLFELTGITTIVITKPEWTSFSTETYLVVGFIYLVCCQFISLIANSVERQFSLHNMR